MANNSLPNNTSAQDLDTITKVDNVNNPPVSGPNTSDISWNNLGVLLSNVPALGLTADRFWCQFTAASTTGGLVLLNWRAVWQNATPTSPVLSRTSTGIFTITLPTSVSSEWDAGNVPSIGNNYVVNLLGGVASLQTDPSHDYSITVGVVANVITLTVRVNGALSDVAGTNIFVKMSG